MASAARRWRGNWTSARRRSGWRASRRRRRRRRERRRNTRWTPRRTASEAKGGGEERSTRLERALETLAAKTAELDALRARHAEDSGLSAAEASALPRSLRKGGAPRRGAPEIAGTRRAGRAALTQERLATAAECAREELSARAAAKEGRGIPRRRRESERGGRDAAAARAAEAMARDLSERTEGEVSGDQASGTRRRS